MRYFLLPLGFFCSCCIHITIYAQVNVKNSANFTALTDSSMKAKPQILGFRIVLAFDGNKELIDSLKIKFQEKHPKTEAYVWYEAPNYKLAVGDFKTEIEAQVLAKKLPLEFPLTLVQKMPINLSRID
ncbi:MAG: hypothetical protein ACKO5L_07305 [Bacteroidota bacterium]